jgi:hypothetical protein
MIKTKDYVLKECQPSNVSWERYINECEEAVNTTNLQSDEYSTDDEALATEERNNNKRLERNRTNDSVIKIHQKSWRSSRVCKVTEILRI